MKKLKLPRLGTPEKLQAFLDTLAYNPEDGWFRCPARVVRDRVAHCFEGAVFAAAVLREQGYPPLIVNMFPEPGTDDEHLIAVYRRYGAWGAVGLSNFVGLRAREPIHRTMRELMLSYFEQYYNVKRQKTLRTYTRPLNLAAYDRHDWLNDDDTMFRIDRKLDALKRIPLLSPAMIRGLLPVDERSYHSGLSGANPDGLYAPG
jgi:hypothetical protein